LLSHTHSNQRNPPNKPPIPTNPSTGTYIHPYCSRIITSSISLLIIIRHLLIKILRRLGRSTSRSTTPTTPITPSSPPTTGSPPRLPTLWRRSNGPVTTMSVHTLKREGWVGVHNGGLLDSLGKGWFRPTRIHNNLNLQSTSTLKNGTQAPQGRGWGYLQTPCIIDEFAIIPIIRFLSIPLLRKLKRGNAL